MSVQDLNFLMADMYIPDEEGGEEASADPDVKEGGVTKLGDVATDPVVQQKHIEDAGDGKRKKKTDVCNKGIT